jgi:hypothetical protein
MSANDGSVFDRYHGAFARRSATIPARWPDTAYQSTTIV